MPESPEQRWARLARWEHFRLVGSICLARHAMLRISYVESTTPEAKEQAAKIERELLHLLTLMKKRQTP